MYRNTLHFFVSVENKISIQNIGDIRRRVPGTQNNNNLQMNKLIPIIINEYPLKLLLCLFFEIIRFGLFPFFLVLAVSVSFRIRSSGMNSLGAYEKKRSRNLIKYLVSDALKQ
ncbi:hypothetical protein ACJX0J_012526 [Zea mays]